MGEEVIPKGYKRTEVGVIPEDWGSEQIRNICQMKSGLGITSANIDAHSLYPCYGGNGLRGFTNDYTHDGSHALIGRQGALCGNVIGVSGKFYASEHAIVVSSTKGTDIHWLTFCLSRLNLNRLSESSAQPGLSVGKVISLRLARPSNEEQRAIAAALSDIDALISSLDKLISKKRALKQAVMQQLLTGQKRLPGFQGEWGKKPLSFYAGFITKGATPTTYGFKWEEDGVLFLRSECVAETGLDLRQAMFISRNTHSALLRGEVSSGDLLITITGNVGRVVYLGPKFGIANINQHIARIRIVKPELDSKYLFHFLSQEEMQTYFRTITTGQAYPQLSLKQVRETLISVPSIEEQTAIATILSDMEAELAALEQRRDKTRLLKQGMMQELLTGRIRLVPPASSSHSNASSPNLAQGAPPQRPRASVSSQTA